MNEIDDDDNDKIGGKNQLKKRQLQLWYSFSEIKEKSSRRENTSQY
jgi:hypothetical protein